MKIIFSLLVLLGVSAQADHYHNQMVYACKMTKMIDQTYFEESLSVEEYPSVDVAIAPNGEYSISYGGWGPLEKKEGDQVSLKKSGNQVVVIVHRAKTSDLIKLTIDLQKRKGVVEVNEKRSGYSVIGYAKCKAASGKVLY